VTRLGDQWVRPHDIEVLFEPHPDGVPARVVRLQRVGFEVRAELRTEPSTGSRAGGSDPWVQLTRAQADDLALTPDRQVWLRPHRAATRLGAS
ncbi:MAG: sulfate/thiosulfate transport system ATP-binding protein, partial [Actinomycetota bacterium]|nr:sulfate/thiosulfate transport system ATP-binding protein [Actinomycetota bacterium]